MVKTRQNAPPVNRNFRKDKKFELVKKRNIFRIRVFKTFANKKNPFNYVGKTSFVERKPIRECKLLMLHKK